MKRRQVELAASARIDLADLEASLSIAAGPRVSRNYLSRVRRFLSGLATAAERGRRADDIIPGLRIVGFERSLVVAYVVEDQRVVVLALRRAGWDWTRLGTTA